MNVYGTKTNGKPFGNVLLRYLFCLCIGVAVSVALICVFSLMLAYMHIPDGAMPFLACASVFIGSGTSALFNARFSRRGGLKCGAVSGIVFALLHLVLCLVLGASDGVGVFVAVCFAVEIVGAVIGGIIGVNTVS